MERTTYEISKRILFVKMGIFEIKEYNMWWVLLTQKKKNRNIKHNTHTHSITAKLLNVTLPFSATFTKVTGCALT